MHLLCPIDTYIGMEYLLFNGRVQFSYSLQLINLLDIVPNFPWVTEGKPLPFLIAIHSKVNHPVTPFILGPDKKLHQQTLQHYILNGPCHHFHNLFINVQYFFQGYLLDNFSLLDQLVHELIIVQELKL